MSDLFRQEVIDRQTSRHLGDVILAAPKTLLFYFGLILTLVIIAFGIIGFGSYAVNDELSGSVIAVLPNGEYEVALNGKPGVLAAIRKGQSLSLELSNDQPIVFTVDKTGPARTIPVNGGNFYTAIIRVKAPKGTKPLALQQHVGAAQRTRRKSIRSLFFGDVGETEK